MILYHFTAATPCHLGSILAAGEIQTTESNISFAEEHAGPGVVWLTDTEDPTTNEEGDLAAGLDGLKMSACLTVDVDDAEHSPEWSRRHGISEPDYEALTRAGGDPGEWWVVTHPIRRWAITGLRIKELISTLDGEVLLPAAEFDRKGVRHLFQSRGAQRGLRLLDLDRLGALADTDPDSD